MHFGYHLLLDCSNCNRDQIASAENIKAFVIELVKRIDMVAVGDPTIQYLCEGDEKEGFSLMQLISTSSIVGHFMDRSGDAYIDVFSCKTFDIKMAEDVVREFFTPTKVRVNFLTRNADPA